MRKYTMLLFVTTFAVLLLAACTAVTRTPADDGEGAVAGADAKTIAVLGSLSYTGLFDATPITLTNGIYTYTDAASGDQYPVHLLDSFAAYGDLDGDDRTDAVAALELDPRGSGRFTYLAPVLDVWNNPASGPAVELGGNVQVSSITLADGQVVVDYIGHGAGDGDCCPTYNRRNTYAWQEGSMAEVSNEELGKAELPAAEQGSATPVPDELTTVPDVDFTQYLSLDEARKLRVGVIIPTQTISASLQQHEVMLQAYANKQLNDEDRQRLLVETVIPSWGGDPQVAIQALEALGIEFVPIEDSTLLTLPDTTRPLLAHSFKTSLNAFLAGLSTPAAVGSLADIVAVNAEDPANRVPYGQAFLEAAAADTMTDAEYDRVRATAQVIARAWMKTILVSNNVDVLVSGMTYASNAGAAGVPALTIPAGLDPSGRPQGVILSGDYLSDPKLLALGYALEQQLQGRMEPDLDAVISTFP